MNLERHCALSRSVPCLDMPRTDLGIREMTKHMQRIGGFAGQWCEDSLVKLTNPTISVFGCLVGQNT